MLDRHLEHTIKVAASRAKLCRILDSAKPYLGPTSQVAFLCKDQKNTVRELFKVAQNSSFEQIHKDNYLEAKKSQISSMNALERDRRAREIDVISNTSNSREFWSTLRKLAPRPSSTCPLSIQSWESFYLTNYSEPFAGIPRQRFQTIHPVLDTPISTVEICSILSHLANNKAPGPNGLTNEFYKSLPPPGIAALKHLFNTVLETGVVPETWGRVKTIVLHKSGDKLDHNNYRNIALFNSITKIYTKIIAIRLQRLCEQEGILPDYQGGFRWERGCDDNLFSLLSAVQIALDQPGRYLFAIFIDFKQAFDSVQHQLLWNKMRELKLGSKALNSIIDLYEKLEMYYEINGEKSNNMKISRGTPQGESLSPLLFILFISGLEKHLREAGLTGSSLGGSFELLTLAFADDFVLLADSAQATQKTLNVLHTYCSSLNLTVNTKKTQVIIFHKSPKYISMPTFTFNDCALKTTNKYKYLGITFSKSGKFNEAVIDRVSKTNQAIGSTVQKLRKAQPRSSLPAEKLFNTVIRTILLYAAEFWAEGFELDLIKAQSNYFKQLYGWHFSTPHYVTQFESGVQGLGSVILKKKLRWLVKLLRMDESRIPRKAYNRLLVLSIINPDSQNPNWVNSLRRELFALGFGEIFDNQDPDSIINHMESIVAAKEHLSRQQNLRRISASSYCPLYRHLLQESPNYLHFNLSCSKLALISQARVSSIREVNLFWNNYRIKLDPRDYCPVCCWDCPDDLIHFLTACPASELIRLKFTSLGSSVDEILRVRSPREADILFIFLNQLIKLRIKIAGS